MENETNRVCSGKGMDLQWRYKKEDEKEEYIFIGKCTVIDYAIGDKEVK